MEENRLSLKDIQNAEYAMMCNLVDFLESHGLTYCLCGGTMLGAVRHNGFIPWDDDIDLFVPRDDYEKLKELIRTKQYKHDYYVLKLPGEDRYAYPFIKMQDTRIKLEEEFHSKEFEAFLFIDVFPLDHLPENETMQKTLFLWNRVQRAAVVTKLIKTGLNRSKPEQMIAKSLYKIWGGYQNINMKIDEFGKKTDTRNQKSPIVRNLVWGDAVKQYLRTDEIYPLKKHPFEDREFNIPNKFEPYLQRCYGDYMTPPPENERARHFFKAYWL